jgi:hypothetical protein
VTSIFVKGCKSQLHWLCYNLQFLERNWTTPDTEVVVMLDEDCRDVVSTWGPLKNVIYCYGEPWPNRYMHALWCKANADLFTRGDPIVLLDCDILMIKQGGLGDYLVTAPDGFNKIILPVLDWKDRGDGGIAEKLWTKIFTDSTGYVLDRDYMVSHPWVFTRSTFYGARLLVEEHRNMPFYAATYSRETFDHRGYLDHPFTFCDLENFGFYAANYQSGTYWVRDWHQMHQEGYQKKFEDQWSHSDFTKEVQDRLNGLLYAPC